MASIHSDLPVPAHAWQAPAPGPEVRLPLQIGTTSLWSLARGALVLVPALTFVPIGIGLVLFGGLGLVVVLVAIALAIYGGMHLRYAWRERPSDVVLSASTIRIDGGGYHGLWAHWANVHRAACALVETDETRLTIFGIALAAVTRHPTHGVRSVRVMRLSLVPRHGAPLVVAQAERPIEMESLRALVECIRSGDAGPEEQARWRWQQAHVRRAALGVQVVSCPHCGAPAQPAEQPSVPCRYCGTHVFMPPDIVMRIGAARATSSGRRRVERMVRRLLDQPGAHVTNRRMLLLGIPMLLAWPTAITLFLARLLTDTLTPWDFFFAPLVPLCLVPALFILLRRALVKRQALRLLTLDCGAHAPARPGDPYACRYCDAPLRPAGDEIVVTCVYCQTDNVLGIDMGHHATTTQQQARTLEQNLQSQDSEGRLWTWMLVPGVALLLTGAVALGMSMGGSLWLPELEESPGAGVSFSQP